MGIVWVSGQGLGGKSTCLRQVTLTDCLTHIISIFPYEIAGTGKQVTYREFKVVVTGDVTLIVVTLRAKDEVNGDTIYAFGRAQNMRV